MTYKWRVPSNASQVATIAMSVAAVVVIGAVIAQKGCGASQPRAPRGYRTENAPFASGGVEGILVFSTGAMARIASTVLAEPDGCDEPAKEMPAVVWIDGPTSGAAPRDDSPEVNLGGCGFEPHVAVAMADTRLTVRAGSEDHRIQAWLDGVRVFDASKGGTAEIRLVSPGIWRIRCAAGHPGEEAWVVATATPYAEVVEAKAFSIDTVPAGRWTLVAWHPALGPRHVDVEIAPKGIARADVEF